MFAAGDSGRWCLCEDRSHDERKSDYNKNLHEPERSRQSREHAKFLPGSARVSRVGDCVSQSRTFLKRLFRRDAETNTRDACATQSSRATHSWEHSLPACRCRQPAGKHAFVARIDDAGRDPRSRLHATRETLPVPFLAAKFRPAQIDPAPVFRARRNPFLAAAQNSAQSPSMSAKEAACR